MSQYTHQYRSLLQSLCDLSLRVPFHYDILRVLRSICLFRSDSRHRLPAGELPQSFWLTIRGGTFWISFKQEGIALGVDIDKFSYKGGEDVCAQLVCQVSRIQFDLLHGGIYYILQLAIMSNVLVLTYRLFIGSTIFYYYSLFAD